MKNAEVIYQGMQAMARGKAVPGETAKVTWRGITCAYYPGSDRFNWWAQANHDITKGLSKAQVVAMIEQNLAGGQ